MKLHRQIKALLFLTIMGLFTAHNALPHAHHLAVSHAEDHEHTEHTHSHSHENDHHSSEENAENLLLTLLLHSHAHSSHAHVYFTLADVVSKANKNPVSVLPAQAISEELSPRVKEPDKNRQRPFNFFYNDNPALSYYPLRAPPALV